MELALADRHVRAGLFRFVDVFPALNDDEAVLEHLVDELAGTPAPALLRVGLAAATRLPSIGAPIVHRAARFGIAAMAGRFIAAQDPAGAAAFARTAWDRGTGTIIDLLGEKTVTEAEADAYADRLMAMVGALAGDAVTWPSRPLLERDDLGPRGRVSIALKPTAVASLYGPLTRRAGLAQAAARLQPVLMRCAELGVEVWFDMEHAAVRDLTIELFETLVANPATAAPEMADLHAGIVCQAYLRSARADLARLVDLSARRVRAGGAPLGVRLVKGAYWDAETIEARAAGWEPPVLQGKALCDASYERCTNILLDHHGEVRPAFASHNLRSLAHAVVAARSRGLPDAAIEWQVLHGMGDELATAAVVEGLRCGVYAPVGELLPGMAYLVRRLLENTANESFVRQSGLSRRSLTRLLERPEAGSIPDEAVPSPLQRRPQTSISRRGLATTEYDPEPLAEWRRSEVRAAMQAAVDAERARAARRVAPVIDGRRIADRATDRSVDPSRTADVIAVVGQATLADVDAALAVARRVQPDWAARTPSARAAVLFAAAAEMRDRRLALAALCVREAGKPWAEADADVCEAIDFCEYYGREAIRLGWGGEVQSPPGERNILTYEARGVVAVIAPWNFPLAIPTGMTVAALVAGNSVVLKPAEQTPTIAHALVEALERAGLPAGVLGFVPGRGETVGAALAASPLVDAIVFTGSREVGLAITAAAAAVNPLRRSIPRVITELGGKNAAVVASDADLDMVVPAVVASAFGFAGQKCSALSRLIVCADVYDQVVERVVGAAGVIPFGDAADMGTVVGPVIDADAEAKIRGLIDAGANEGRVALARVDGPSSGTFVGPTVIADIDTGGRVWREEVFGPVLVIAKARDLDHALELANDTQYALTAGIFSRSPSTVRRFAAALRAGNVYVNRGTTGAVVGRQPFGGAGMSGVGSKAGGPDYLAQLMQPRVVTENLVRQGFAE